jgi:outer membrane immunogenic protein
MKKLLVATVAAVALATVGTAGAADLPVKAPPMAAPVVTYNWTGCWVSGGIGYGMVRQRHHDETDPGLVALTQEVDTGLEGWLGRAGVGCDYQFNGNFLVGVFGDYDWTNFKGDYIVPVNGLVGTERESSSWAAGARIGYLPYPNLLTFVSGGYTQARYDGFGLFTNTVPSVATIFSVGSTTYSGAFIGGGYEYRLPWFQGLAWKTEYRFNFYDSKDLAYLPLALTGTATHMQKDVQTVTTSLVWRFNFGGPVVARY